MIVGGDEFNYEKCVYENPKMTCTSFNSKATRDGALPTSFTGSSPDRLYGTVQLRLITENQCREQLVKSEL